MDDKTLEARLQDYPTLRISTAKLIDEYPQPKQAEKKAEKQAQAREQQTKAGPMQLPRSSKKICRLPRASGEFRQSRGNSGFGFSSRARQFE